MASLFDPDLCVFLRVEEETPVGKFCDNIIMSVSDYISITNANLKKIKDIRRKKWEDHVGEAVTEPPNNTEKSIEEMLAEKIELQARLEDLLSAIETKQKENE